MGFPLGARVELDLGGWTDVTDRVLARDPISIRRGRSGDASSADPAECRFTLRNDDRAFSMRNPLSPYYEVLRRSVRCRVSLPADATGLLVRRADPGRLRASRAWTPADASDAVSATLDVRVDMDAERWQWGHLVGRWAGGSPGQRSWTLVLRDDGCLALYVSADGVSTALLVVSDRLPDYMAPGRRAVRAVLDLSTGATDFYTAESISGPWTVLSSHAGTGPVSVFSGSADLEVGRLNALAGQALAGRVFAVEVRVDGALVASPRFVDQEPGAVSFEDDQGRVWSVDDDAEITDRDYRFYGEVPQWPEVRGAAAADRTVEVTAYGPRRRLTLNPTPLDSVLFREMTRARSGIVAYWPMEEGAGATQLASGLDGAPPMRVTGSPALGEYQDYPSSRQLPLMRTGTFTGDIAPHPATGELSLQFFVDARQPPASNQVLFALRTSSLMWLVDIGTDGALRLRVTTLDESATVFTSAWTFSPMGSGGLQALGFAAPCLMLRQVGSDVEYTFMVVDIQHDYIWEQNLATHFGILGTLSNRQVGRATRLIIGGSGGLGEIAVGHAAVSTSELEFLSSWGALNTWNGETPEERLYRLSAEDAIPVRVYDGAPQLLNAHRLGDQVAETWTELVDEVEAADMGILTESRDSLALEYRCRTYLTNQLPVAELDCAAGDLVGVLQPSDDDSALVNDVVVRRRAGGSVRAEQRTGPLSVADPPDGVGRYTAEVEISAQTEAWLPDQASYRLRHGTVDRPRYPDLVVELANPRLSAEAVAALRRVNVGDRVDLLHPEPWTERAPLLVMGYVEDLGVVSHRLTLHAVPAEPWQAAVVEEARYDTAGSVLELDVPEEDAEPDPLGLPVASWAGAGLADSTPVESGTAGTGDTPWTGATTGAFVMDGGRVRMDQQSGQTAQLIWNSSVVGTSRTRYGLRFWTEWSGYPNVGSRITMAYGASTTLLWFVDVTSTGIMRLRDGSSTTLDQTAAAIPLGTPLRVDVLVDEGDLSVRVVDAADVLVAELSGSVTIGPVHEVRFGNHSTATLWPRLWLWDLAFTDPDNQLPVGGVVVRTTVGPRWVDSAGSPADFPFDVMVNGERMTVTAVDGTSEVQTFSVIRGVNGVRRAHSAGSAVALADPAYVTL